MADNRRGIVERTQFLMAVEFSGEHSEEVERVLEWLADNEAGAAAYIVWLECMLSGDSA